MNEKNKLNNIDEKYYQQVILPNLKYNFKEIDAILKQGRMSEIANKYQNLGLMLTKHYLSQEKIFNGIAKHIEYVSDKVYTRGDKVLETAEKDMVSLILHHMYYQCFYGIRENSKEEISWD